MFLECMSKKKHLWLPIGKFAKITTFQPGKRPDPGANVKGHSWSFQIDDLTQPTPRWWKD